jgi:DNA replication protein DnaC
MNDSIPGESERDSGACALAQKACRDGYSALFTRAQALFRDLAMARADGSLRSLLVRLSRIDVLVIDDWAMAPLSEPERRDFWEICEDRYQVRSTILTSQLPVSRWHEQIGEPDIGRRYPGPAGPQRPPH